MTPPSIVLTLSKHVGLVPLDWSIQPGSVIIVFESGEKMTFDRAEVITPNNPAVNVKEISPKVPAVPVKRVKRSK